MYMIRRFKYTIIGKHLWISPRKVLLYDKNKLTYVTEIYVNKVKKYIIKQYVIEDKINYTNKKHKYTKCYNCGTLSIYKNNKQLTINKDIEYDNDVRTTIHERDFSHILFL